MGLICGNNWLPWTDGMGRQLFSFFVKSLGSELTLNWRMTLLLCVLFPTCWKYVFFIYLVCVWIWLILLKMKNLLLKILSQNIFYCYKPFLGLSWSINNVMDKIKKTRWKQTPSKQTHLTFFNLFLLLFMVFTIFLFLFIVLSTILTSFYFYL